VHILRYSLSSKDQAWWKTSNLTRNRPKRARMKEEGLTYDGLSLSWPSSYGQGRNLGYTTTCWQWQQKSPKLLNPIFLNSCKACLFRSIQTPWFHQDRRESERERERERERMRDGDEHNQDKTWQLVYTNTRIGSMLTFNGDPLKRWDFGLW